MTPLFDRYMDAIKHLLDQSEYYIQREKVEQPLFIDEVTERIRRCRQSNGTVYWVGNGGSAAIAAHGAIDCLNSLAMKAMVFSDDAALTCFSNDFGYAQAFARPLRLFAQATDLLIAISSSGKSESILNALQVAQERNCPVLTLSGFASDNPLRQRGDYNIYVPSNHYGLVESVHGVLCHAILDTFSAIEKGEARW
ncbi:SIS domain-containing protein [Heliobacterium gestii]|uniref:SIS domain-containing protein n=1 Tax=Heliomicrobium gestii TaxID=2699 RepID=A0A845LCF4_HELGE|nr:SIS domain-containing protein [Heliomicrobium gestii]MBM7866686.1 D-sedoheptulose 7-phosphate isomerase [Heliomicrobium gestii]MZP43034.1 SIS domain-containing protein [Heliomicrobium gestii]